MSNSVAIVTGASSGIGKATSLRLARDLGAIVLAARSGEKLGEVGRQVKTIGAEPLVLELDLMAPTAAEIVVKKTLDPFGRIDALVNIADAVVGLDVFQMSDEQWNTGMELKFHGARRLTVHAWDALRESKGTVVFVSGNVAVIPKRMRRQSARSMRQSKPCPRRSLNAASRRRPGQQRFAWRDHDGTAIVHARKGRGL